MMRGTGNENAAGLRRICKLSDKPKRSIADNYVESLTGQWQDRIQTESQEL